MKRPSYRWLVPFAGLVAAVVYLWSLATPQIGKPVILPPAADDKLWSFGFVGDTQLGEGIVDRIFASLDAANVEFVLHLGDIVDNAASDEQWEEVIGAARRHHLRLRPVVGNHDRLVGTSDRGEARFGEYFPDLPGTFYRFSHGGLAFLMLNSERSLMPWTEQGCFLGEQLKKVQSTTVVCLHRPVFTCGRRDLANQFLRRVSLHARLADTPATLVLSGHHHYYDRTLPLDGITYVVSGGGSHKLYPAADADATTAAFHAGVNHYGLVDVYTDRLDVRVLSTDGTELDRFSVACRLASDETETAELKSRRIEEHGLPSPSPAILAAWEGHPPSREGKVR